MLVLVYCKNLLETVLFKWTVVYTICRDFLKLKCAHSVWFHLVFKPEIYGKANDERVRLTSRGRISQGVSGIYSHLVYSNMMLLMNLRLYFFQWLLLLEMKKSLVFFVIPYFRGERLSSERGQRYMW